MFENLSIIVPCYNEKNRIADCIEYLFSKLQNTNNIEVIIVNDGSTDETEDIINNTMLKYIEYNIFKLISYKVNEGKGYAVKTGIINARYKYICFLDCDLSVDLEELKKLWPYRDDGLIIASREMLDSQRIPNQPLFRMFIGKIYSLFIRTYLGITAIDQQCGCKLATSDLMNEIVIHQQIDRFSFDTEWIYICKKKNYTVKEIGIIWENNADTRVKIFRDSWRMFNDTRKIKKYHKNIR